MDKRFDVTSLGSTLLRLSVPPGDRLETAPMFEVRTAGTESNTLTALSRMGKKTGWVSRLTNNPLGRRIAREIGSFGVDVSRVIWTDQDRNETFFVEYGAAPRPTQVIYDRRHSAVANIAFEEMDLEYLLSGRILHLTGIFPALSENCADVLRRVMNEAKKAEVKISFDLNYRAKLWNPQQAKTVLSPIMKKADIILVTREDAVNIFSIAGTAEEMVSALYKEFSPELCVVTLGTEGGIAFDGKSYYTCKGYPAETLDRLGAGDSFSAGVLCGVLENSVQTGMDYASAMAALKLGLRGDYFVSDKAEVLRVLNSQGQREVGR